MAKGDKDKSDKTPSKKVSLLAKPSNASGGGKGKKKKWSKGKVKDKTTNSVYFDQEALDKLLNEIPAKTKLITPSVLYDKLNINVSLARHALADLEARGVLKAVGDLHHAQKIYTRATQAEA
ncbi:unnamed protein product [Blepharisma stoltei]|uniref:40S ribosomal protein S25 n=1 Tax=Blepharisma stoltei TaxID=1481888 RepID=A0AAU9KDQ7_9CILI|nr:unnamed protein product [Blepharisma stoltei]